MQSAKLCTQLSQEMHLTVTGHSEHCCSIAVLDGHRYLQQETPETLAPKRILYQALMSWKTSPNRTAPSWSVGAISRTFCPTTEWFHLGQWVQAHDTPGVQDVPTRQHFSQAPPRYTEAQLVKTLQEMGIGRPSTYAPIISVLQVLPLWTLVDDVNLQPCLLP